MSRWMIAWTRPGYAVLRDDDTGKIETGFEFVVRDRLIEEGLECFVPAIRKERVVRNWSRRVRNLTSVKEQREIVHVPAFPRYILFRGTEIQPIWQRAIRVDGVTVVVRQPGDRVEPGHLPERVVAMLRGPDGDGVIQDLTKTVEAIARFVRGTGVRITAGPFTGFIGTVVGHEGKNVRVLLSVFGRESEAAMSPESVERTGA